MFRTALRSSLVLAAGLAVATVWLQAASHPVTQKGKVFAPGTITVKVGDTVTFKNDDDVTHNAFSTSKGNEFNAKAQTPGSTSEVAFKAKGTVAVKCARSTRACRSPSTSNSHATRPPGPTPSCDLISWNERSLPHPADGRLCRGGVPQLRGRRASPCCNSAASTPTTANVTRRALPSVRALGSIGLATARFRMATLQFVAASETERASARRADGQGARSDRAGAEASTSR